MARGRKETARIGSLRQRLLDSFPTATSAGRAIGNFMLMNLQDLPFETAATIAAKLDISELTVGRFCRALGYQHFKDLKRDLQNDFGDNPWLSGDRLRAFQARSRSGQDELSRSLELQVAALVQVYEMAQTAEFQAVVRRLATIEQIYAVGFQTERGLADIFVHQMQYLRDGVHLADLSAGNFAELLLSNPNNRALVIFEARRYSRQAELLARRAHEAGIPVTLITDPYCEWAHGCVSEIFAVASEVNLFLNSTGMMATLIHLFLNGVSNEIGPEVAERMSRVSNLYHQFVGHIGREPAPPALPAAAKPGPAGIAVRRRRSPKTR